MKTLKKMLFTAVFAAVAFGASAQMNWGVKAGLNTSSITGDHAKYRAGFHIGVMNEYMFTPKFGIESGFYYSMLGYDSESFMYDGRTVDAQSHSASYLQLPVAATYKIGVGQDLFLCPNAGIYLGYGIAGKDNYFDRLNRFDMGGVIGANLQYNKFQIGLGYEQGFISIWDAYKYYGTNMEIRDASNRYNSNVKVSLGYFF